MVRRDGRGAIIAGHGYIMFEIFEIFLLSLALSPSHSQHHSGQTRRKYFNIRVQKHFQNLLIYGLSHLLSETTLCEDAVDFPNRFLRPMPCLRLGQALHPGADVVLFQGLPTLFYSASWLC